jgi:hypothetical protein
VDGEDYTLPDLDTRTWLEALVLKRPYSWLAIIPAELAPADQDRLWERLFDPDDDLDLDDLEVVAETVLTEACGMDFDPACQLALSAYGNWLLFDGWCTSVGLDPLRVPVSRLLAATYTWRRSLCSDKKDLAKLDNEIWVSPPPLTASGRSRDQTPRDWSDEREEETFLSALSAIGYPVRR